MLPIKAMMKTVVMVSTTLEKVAVVNREVLISLLVLKPQTTINDKKNIAIVLFNFSCNVMHKQYPFLITVAISKIYLYLFNLAANML